MTNPQLLEVSHELGSPASGTARCGPILNAPRREAGAPIVQREGSWFTVLVMAVCMALAAGCASKSKSAEQVRLAYLAGQRDAIAQMSQEPVQAANVTLIGPIDNPVVPWTQGLTLAQAILSAGYHSPVDPVMITIRRTREEIQVDPARLLSGGDFPLQPGDIIQFQLPVQ